MITRKEIRTRSETFQNDVLIGTEGQAQNGLNDSQLAKLKKSIPLILLPWNFLGRCIWSKKFQLYFKNYKCCEYVKFGANSWKSEILEITAEFKFFTENSFAHMLLV